LRADEDEQSAEAIVARGGAKVAERCVAIANGGNVTYHEYLRPLRLA
jgi:type III secretion system FlhB-like substrate exporter